MPTPQRISLIEAYDNRDVIAWLVRHTEEIKDLQDAIDALPESDKFVLTIGDQTINGTKSFVNKIAAAGGIEADTLVRINADLQVYGDIYQNGSAYDTHAEQLYSTKDYILMRDGAVTGLASGAMSGLEIIKYDGTNNLRLAADSSGVARIGDVGDEQPLLTRAEAADLTDGDPLCWDSAGQKAVPFTIAAGQNITIAPQTHGIEISAAGGGGTWVEQTSTDWSNFISYSNGEFVVSKDVKIYEKNGISAGRLLFDLVAGMRVPDTSMNGSFRSIGIYQQKEIWIENLSILPETIISANVRNDLKKISFSTDGTMVSLGSTSTTTFIAKNTFLVMVKQ